MASNADEFDDFFANDDEEGGEPAVVDTRADGRLLHIPRARIAPNTVNPRTHFGSPAELEDFGRSLKRRQQQPITVVSRSVYLKLWGHGDRIGDVDFVIVSGERRYRAACAVDLAGLDVVVNDDIAADRKTFLDAVVSENVDRKNFDAIEEAYAVQALVTAFGSSTDVAKHFDRVPGWVTQRVCLTYLAPTLQEQVRRREISLEKARKLGQLTKKHDWDEELQLRWLAEDADKPKPAPKATPEPALPTRAPEPAGSAVTGEAEPRFTAVKEEPAPAAEGAVEPAPSASATSADFTAVKSDGPASAPAASEPGPAEPQADAGESVPEPRGEQQPAEPEATGEQRVVKKFPYDDADEAAFYLETRMSKEVFAKMMVQLKAVEEKRASAAS